VGERGVGRGCPVFSVSVADKGLREVTRVERPGDEGDGRKDCPTPGGNQSCEVNA
jgi:hypothetical protein